MANSVEGRLVGRFFKHGGPEGLDKPAPLPRQQHLFFRLEIVEERPPRNACRLRDGFQRRPLITVGDEELKPFLSDALKGFLSLLFAAAFLLLRGDAGHGEIPNRDKPSCIFTLSVTYTLH